MHCLPFLVEVGVHVASLPRASIGRSSGRQEDLHRMVELMFAAPPAWLFDGSRLPQTADAHPCALVHTRSCQSDEGLATGEMVNAVCAGAFRSDAVPSSAQVEQPDGTVSSGSKKK
jgi:hypothetical protein